MKALSAVQVDIREWRMLWDASAINGYAVEASDGRLGTVDDLYRQKVKGSPQYDPSIAVDGAYEEQFLTYCAIRWVAP